MLTNDPEVRSDVKAYATHVEKCTNIGSERFSRFSQWSTLQGAIARLITAAQSRSKARAAQEKGPPTQAYEQAKVVIVRCVQYEAFTKDNECLKHHGYCHIWLPNRKIKVHVKRKHSQVSISQERVLRWTYVVIFHVTYPLIYLLQEQCLFNKFAAAGSGARRKHTWTI